MTTIAANSKQIASDLQVTHGGGMKFKVKTKIVEIFQPLVHPYRFWLGLCGDVGSFTNVIAWLTDPASFKKPPSSKGGEFLVLNEKGKIFTFDKASEWLPVSEPFYAVGSGSHFAMGAMMSGKTPLEAVRLASKHDPYTGCGFKYVNVDGTKTKTSK